MSLEHHLPIRIDFGIGYDDRQFYHRDGEYSAIPGKEEIHLEEACIKGTTEVITPMLSSTLTTIAVFVPLVFMSGIAGAIFYRSGVLLLRLV